MMKNQESKDHFTSIVFLHFLTNQPKLGRKKVYMPCETPVCHHQSFAAPPCARREPPRTPEIEKKSIAQKLF